MQKPLTSRENSSLGLGIAGVVLTVIAGVVALSSPTKGFAISLGAAVVELVALGLARNADREAAERLARAEAAMVDVRQNLGPRSLEGATIVAMLKGKPGPKLVEFVYKPNDKEAHKVATQIHRWLGSGVNGDGAGWRVSEVRPIDDSDVVRPPLTGMRLNRWRFVVLIVNALPPDEQRPSMNLPADALAAALLESGSGATVWAHPAVAPDTIRVAVGLQ
jgi:hypothetical protein